ARIPSTRARTAARRAPTRARAGTYSTRPSGRPACAGAPARPGARDRGGGARSSGEARRRPREPPPRSALLLRSRLLAGLARGVVDLRELGLRIGVVDDHVLDRRLQRLPRLREEELAPLSDLRHLEVPVQHVVEALVGETGDVHALQ